MSFLFAYFYLRSLNIENQWRPHGLKPDQALGGAFVACLIVSMALSILASAGLRRRAATWIMLAAGSVVFGLIAIALQCIEYTQQNFGPTNGAFASVFCGWTAWQLIVMVMGVYWLETIVATELRARRAPAAPHGDAAAGQVREADRLIAPGIGAAAFFWTYLGALGVIMYVVLYIV
jgi:heme/copper-type cytochrome/quinol oxidase subunit 3